MQLNIKLKSSKAWAIWLLAAGFFFFEYFARVAPSVMVPHLMAAFQVGALSLGALSAYFYYAYVIMQIPVGTLYDRLGTHRLLTATAALCSLSCFAFAFSTSLWIAALARLFMGFSAAFAFVGALKLAREWFPAHRFGLLAGATQALGMLGAAVGEGPVAVLVRHIDWRPAMALIGTVLFMLAIGIGLIVRDKPISQQELVLAPRNHLLSDLLIVLRNPSSWIIAIIVGFLYAPTAAFAELWGASYLHNVYGIKPEIAASAVSCIFLGWALGGPLGGWFSDHIQKRKPVVLVSAIFSFFFLSCALYMPATIPTSLIFIFLFLYGFSNIGVATCYTIGCEIVPKSTAGTAAGFVNMASVIIGAAFQPLIGWLLDLRWNQQWLNGVRYYTPHDYRLVMMALPFCFIISIIAWFFLTESFKSHRLKEVTNLRKK